MDESKEYFRNICSLINKIETEEMEAIKQVAEWMSTCIIDGGIPHVFGSGHSMIPAREVFIRAGSLSCIRAIGLERLYGKFERIEGVAEKMLGDYLLEPGGVLIVISNSGMNAVPIEMAMIAKEKGCKTVAVTSMAHTQKVVSRHSSGKRLFEICDIYIDNHVSPGDASVSFEGFKPKAGPLSTIAGVTIMNTIVVETVKLILEKGGDPPVRISRNIEGGEEHNKKFKEIYGIRIPELKN